MGDDPSRLCQWWNCPLGLRIGSDGSVEYGDNQMRCGVALRTTKIDTDPALK